MPGRPGSFCAGAVRHATGRVPCAPAQRPARACAAVGLPLTDQCSASRRLAKRSTHALESNNGTAELAGPGSMSAPRWAACTNSQVRSGLRTIGRLVRKQALTSPTAESLLQTMLLLSLQKPALRQVCTQFCPPKLKLAFKSLRDRQKTKDGMPAMLTVSHVNCTSLSHR